MRKGYHAAWRAKNPSKVKAACAAWRAKNPEKIKLINAVWQAKNLEKVKVRRRTWYKKNRKRILKALKQNYDPKKHRIKSRKYKYGLGEQKFNALMRAQANKCVICKRRFSWHKKNSKPHVDHSHLTDKIRGLLCSKCNLALGLFGDCPKVLRRAADYLEKSK